MKPEIGSDYEVKENLARIEVVVAILYFYHL